tara:strand:+ start:76660 stop:77814 length:1155 start_codon:yes stop_codon:yes gene_type:complete
MNPWTQKLVLTVAGCVLLAQPVSAQKPQERDHRKPVLKAPAPATIKGRDHRDAKKVENVDERDHRNKKKVDERDHRNDKKVDERDHRNDKPAPADPPQVPEVRDHRGAEGTTPLPTLRDHRDVPAPKVVPPGAPVVRDQRSAVPVHGERRNEVVPSVRGTSHKRWSSYQIPVVKRYWPNKGAVGTTVTVNGANFVPGLALYLGNTAISNARITPTTITFAIPAGATNGVITARGQSKRPLAIGSFEVAAAYDAKAEQKKRDDERRALAESNWKARKANLANDRAARLVALQEREAALQASQDQRRTDRRAAIRGNFEAEFLADEATLAELALHAERTARLQRMLRLAEANASEKLIIRIDVALSAEDDRHTGRLATLKAAFQVN